MDACLRRHDKPNSRNMKQFDPEQILFALILAAFAAALILYRTAAL